MWFRNKSNLRSESGLVFTYKIWGPGLLFGISVGFLAKSIGTIIVFWPLVLLGFFFLSLAQVEATDHMIRYRRFLKWRELPYSKVVDSSKGLLGTGYIRLDSFVPPWGKIYFVRDETPTPWRQSRLIAYINARARGNLEAASDIEKASLRVPRPLVCVGLVFAGIVFAFIRHTLFPSIAGPPQSLPSWVAGFESLLRTLTTLPVGLIVLGLLAWQAARLKFSGQALVIAFIVGLLLGSFAIQALFT